MEISWCFPKKRVQSGFSGGTYFLCDWALDPAQKICLGVSKILVKFTCFLVKNIGGKKRVSNDKFLLIKRILLSFPQFCIPWSSNFIGSSTMYMNFFRILLTNLQKCLEKFRFPRRSEICFFQKLFLDSLRSNYLWRLVDKIPKNFMSIVLLPIKLEPQGIKIVEMRAHPFLPHKCFTKKHMNLTIILDTPRQFFCAGSNVQLMI
jgi:hypothetical protein